MNTPGTANPPHIPAIESGSYPKRAGNIVRPLVDGRPAYRRICAAVEGARHSVWVTVTFITREFQMPGGRGSPFDVLDRVAARGLDVRVIFWRPNPESSDYGHTFSGSEEDRRFLQDRGSRIRARWDRAPEAFCQHQKSWLIDAGHDSETAFVGGINLTARAVGTPGHESGGEERHDIYIEVTGPAATDVHHNFAQRWNEASERHAADGVWGHDSAGRLAFPTRLSAPKGTVPVQIQRMVPAERYSDGCSTPGGRPHAIVNGERSIFDQYCAAIDSAQHTIYIENQSIPIPEIAMPLEAALKRGVDVAILVPAEPEELVRYFRKSGEYPELFDGLAALGRYPNFLLAGIAAKDSAGRRRNIYVHAKVMLIDDSWATIGSCNLHWHSLNGNTEMNASFWDAVTVRALRCELFAEHLGKDTTHQDDRAALARYRQVALANARRREAGDPDWQGMVFSLHPVSYGG
jgi:phosphatidylserine/phosphatidylglycerophosphate/cardiolipin synthase-like enzyme